MNPSNQRLNTSVTERNKRVKSKTEHIGDRNERVKSKTEHVSDKRKLTGQIKD